jgi:adenylate cyclase
MGADEVRTVHDLKERQAIVLPMVGKFGGRIIDTAGDGILAAFPSVVNAVKCAIAIQSEMTERNSAIDPKHRMQFRIGINIGDIIYDDARIYGDGINVAARLEGIAEPGGISISEDAWRQVQGKVAVSFHDTGEQHLKNIARPVRTYRIELAAKAAAAPHALPRALALPDKPSIAVLAFNNMSGDPEQEYFSDGITEDIITDLSKIGDLLVIARNSSFVYKGKPIDVKQSVVSLVFATFSKAACARRAAGSGSRASLSMPPTVHISGPTVSTATLPIFSPYRTMSPKVSWMPLE